MQNNYDNFEANYKQTDVIIITAMYNILMCEFMSTFSAHIHHPYLPLIPKIVIVDD